MKVKTKVFCALFPFPIRVLQAKKGGGWTIEEMHP